MLQYGNRRPEMTQRKTFKGDFRKMEPTFGKEKQEREFHGEKGMAAWIDATKEEAPFAVCGCKVNLNFSIESPGP